MKILKNKKTAIIFGASGLVGGYCLNELLANEAYQKVLSFGRRKLLVEHDKLVQRVIDFDRMEKYAKFIQGNDLFICLGTTRAKAGKEGFIKVDFEYSFNAAKFAAMNGVNQLLLISSVGANKNSFFLYPKTKGRLEEAVKKLPFWAVHILQPSLLLGEREETRLGEMVAIKASNIFNQYADGLLQKYTPIESEVLAKAMVNLAQGIKEGIHIYESHELIELVEERRLVR